MKTRTRLSIALLLASCAAIAAAVAGPRAKPASAPAAKGIPRYGMMVYSDLCVNPATGDFGGQRITLQRFAEVDTVIYEFTAGALSWPLVANDVNIDPRGKMMYFTVEVPEEGERTISGKFSPDGETLTLDGGYCADKQQPMTLTRMQDFGAKLRACKACPPPKPGKEKPADDETPAPDKAPAPKWEPAPPMQG
jgi:hypothetical protein